jgi:hypothetical protein
MADSYKTAALQIFGCITTRHEARNNKSDVTQKSRSQAGSQGANGRLEKEKEKKQYFEENVLK